MSAQWPHVKAWIAATIPTLAGLDDVTVFAGPSPSGASPARFVEVGFVDDDNGGSYQRTPAYDGTVWTETGEIRTKIVAQSGSGDPSGAETQAFAVADALDAKVRADRTLGGVLSQDGFVDTLVDVVSVSNANGTATGLVYVLRYSTTT